MNPVYKSGTWGKPKKDTFSQLPALVRETVLHMSSGEEEQDWEYFATEGNTWFVAKLWEQNRFEIVASIVKHISSPVDEE